VTSERPDDELLARLRDALRAEPVEPDEAAWASLEAALADLAAPAGAGAGAPRSRVRRPLARRRASVLALTLASALTVSGVAAAAVATNTLPGPLRSLAYGLGLPVTSPGLYQAQQEATQLRESLHAHLQSRAHSIGQSLAQHLKSLDSADRSSIAKTADGLLQEAGVDVSGAVGPVATTTTGAGHEGDGGSSNGSPSGGSDDPSSTGTSTTSTLLPLVTLPGVDGGGGDH
jgi:hypothetical protein